MSLRKLWLIILVLVSVVAIGINTWVLAFLTDRHFSDYLNESYELHVRQILEYSQEAMVAQVPHEQMVIELESHLSDPIVGLKLYNTLGELLVEVGNSSLSPSRGGMINKSHMMGHKKNTNVTEEVSQYNILYDGQQLGTVNIVSQGMAENSYVGKRFKGALFSNSLIAIAIASGVAISIGFFVSQTMSRSLKDTEKLARKIRLGQDVRMKPSGIHEVNGIRESLMELYARLKLKQKTRKTLVDQLVHQTRTPLTILQSHIEAINDGIVAIDDDEVEIFKNQINDITSIISNISSLIGASKDIDELKIETFDVGVLVRQMKQGLMAQFIKKNIALNIKNEGSLILTTDQYKLSQSLYNILMNAYKYTEPTGSVTISYEEKSGFVSIRVQDTGMGISDEDIEKVFSAYYRGAKTENIKGDGIGLYIVRENIERIGGKVYVQSLIGVGSTFTIQFPPNPNVLA